jgi:hypothetical protein
MTTYHLNYWSKVCGSTKIERIYVNADDRSSLGYLERRMRSTPRGTSSYYDQHRRAKGDMFETEDFLSSTLPAEVLDAITAAAVEYDPGHAHLANSDDMGLFIGLKNFTRGVRWLASKKQQQALAKKAAGFTVEI